MANPLGGSASITFGDDAYEAFKAVLYSMSRSRRGGVVGAGYVARVKLDDGRTFDAEILGDDRFQVWAEDANGDLTETEEVVTIDSTNGPFIESVHVW